MKYLFSFILALLCATATAKAPEFTLQFNGEQIIHNQSDWKLASKADAFKVYVEKGMIGHKNETMEFHAYLEFNKLTQLDAVDGKTKRIYTYGVISCSEGRLYLVMDLFTDANNEVRFRSIHELGSYIVDLTDKNTVRNEVYNLICKDSV